MSEEKDERIDAKNFVSKAIGEEPPQFQKHLKV